MKKKNSILQEVESRHRKKKILKNYQVVFYVIIFFLWFSFSIATKGDTEIYFATSNSHKFKIAEKIFGRPLVKKDIDIPEIQGTQCEIIWDKLFKVASRLEENKVLIVEDTSINFEGLYGFPGPYGKDFLKLGIESVIKIVKKIGRPCSFLTIFGLAYKDFNDSIQLKLFRGEVKGLFDLRFKDECKKFCDGFVAYSDQKSRITKDFQDADIGRVKALEKVKKYLKDEILKN